MYSAGISSGRDCEMSQFWQNLQFTLQPAVAMEKAIGAGQVVEQRLLLNGIDVRGADARVDQRVVDAAAILAHAAVAALLVAYDALARAELAPDLAVGQLLVETRFEGELRVALRFRTAGTRDGSGGRSQFAGAERRSRSQRAHQKGAAINGRARRAFCM